MIPFKAISVDDEPRAHEALQALLRDTSDIDLAMKSTSPSQALSALHADRYELLFLDIAMPGMNGLDLLRTLDDPPVTVLLTAHVDYALTAFELGVRDYLLKPVSAQRLSQCLERIRPLLSAARSEGAAKSPARLSIKCGNEYRLIDPARTVRVEAAGNFSIVYSEESEIFASESMKYLQQRLVPFGFVRAHKSHLVNIRYVSSVSTVHIRLLNGHPVPLGRAYRAAVAEVLGHSRCTT